MTACGKSTQGRRLAEQLGVPYVSIRPIMKSVVSELDPSSSEADAWGPATDRRRARNDEIDLASDRRMEAKVAAGPGVFDAWALPWLYRGDDAIRVWIEASLASRVERCLVSYAARGESCPLDPHDLIETKDEFSREQFRRLYGIELGPDPDVFDLVLENSAPMAALTPAAASADAAVFSQRLLDAVLDRLALSSESWGGSSVG